MKKYFSEAIASGIIVFIGAGAILFGETINNIEIGIAFFIAVIMLAYAIGPFSGGHGNPSISIGYYFAKRLSLKDTIFYIIFQFIGAAVSGFFLYAGNGFIADAGLASTTLQGATTTVEGGLFEMFLGFIFVTIVLNVTRHQAYKNYAGIIIGLSLGILVYIGLPVTGGSLNGARSFGTAIFEQGEALTQLWIYLVFPTLGGILAGLLNRVMRRDS